VGEEGDFRRDTTGGFKVLALDNEIDFYVKSREIGDGD
jgi:hypothetical protein